ncbi:MAG: 30S ribosomal protein S17 [Patescibacteria group bacterium]|nr:30S ribosomal protein S17 [Patescibacteria group bacterium]
MKLQGTVVRAKMDKTVIVEVASKRSHPKYGKIINVIKKYYAHFDGVLEPGSAVVIEESKPISKTKRWKVIEVVEEQNLPKSKIQSKSRK